MPGTQPTLTNDGATPAPWPAITGAIGQAGALASATALQTTTTVLDQYQNTTVILGNLAQIVTIGACWLYAPPEYVAPLVPVQGVEVATGLSGFGEAVLTAFAAGLITTTKGSTAATLTHTYGGTFTNGMQIGATVFETPPLYDDEAPENYITPGTTFTIAGPSITLSQDALLSGTDLYACACTWTQSNVNAYP